MTPSAASQGSTGVGSFQGERVRTREYEVQVMRLTPDHRPLRVRFHFVRPLDDPHFRFIYWTGQKFADFRFAPAMARKIIRADFDHTAQLPEELVR
jgi:hypothetical protein